MVLDNHIPAAVVLDVYMHGVCVRNFDAQIKNHLVEFCRLNAQMKLVRVGPGRYEKVMKCIYASTTRTRDQFRFHRNQLNELVRFLTNRGTPSAQIQINHIPLYEPVKVDIKFTDPRPPRDEQIMLGEYLLAPGPEQYAPSKIVTLQTGKGKGFLSIKAMCDLGYRTLIVLKPMYIRKWVKELMELTDLKLDDIMVVSGEDKKYTGAAMLKALLTQGAEKRLDCKVVILSNVIYSDYLDVFNMQMPDQLDYAAHPQDLCQVLGIGTRMIDEVHQDFHRNFRFDLVTHVPHSLNMSATMEPDDPFIARRYQIMFPEATRAPEVEYDAFIDVQSIHYVIENPQLIRCTGFAKSYSHIRFEESILKNKRMLKNYLDMIVDVAYNVYVVDREQGQSALVFCATITMCTLATNHLKAKYPNLSIDRYVSGDRFDACFLMPDIVVSTIGSAGTAVDKPNLRETIMSTALNSKQANIQVLGRTRRLKDWPDRAPRFHFLSASNIAKHMEYAKAKVEKFRGKVNSFKTFISNYRI